MIVGNLMEYIILNGVNSKCIRGLEITMPPPIIKPSIRTVVEEIDGRSGDIVQTLGYSAYNKTFEIYLNEGYDIDDIIAFFDSEGTVTFSNEPNKYYNYQIIEPIDFQAGEITVTMHVQPFKYSLAEGVKSFLFNRQLIQFGHYRKMDNGVLVTAENNEITITGHSVEGTEYYIPISPLELAAGQYELSIFSVGSIVNDIFLKIVRGHINFAQLGEKNFVYNDGETANEIISLKEPAKYDCVNMRVPIKPANGSDCVIRMSLYNTVDKKVVVINRGNVISRPKLTIHGVGKVEISLNRKTMFNIDLKDDKYITIDSDKMEAYKDKDLKNRAVTGSYDAFVLTPGENIIEVAGNVSKVDIENFSRWI